MSTLEKQAPPTAPHAIDQPGFKRFMHEWEEKLHHHVEVDDEEVDTLRQREPEHKRAA